MRCPGCGHWVITTNEGRCPSCRRGLFPSQAVLDETGRRKHPPYLAVLSALFVLGGPVLSIATCLLGLALSAMGIPTGLDRFSAYCLLPVPLLCIVGVVLGHRGYPRYRREGQVFWVVITGLAIAFGWTLLAVSVVGLCLLWGVLLPLD
jgi:hypothetical protein